MRRGRGIILPEMRSLYAPQQSAAGPWDLGLPHRAGRCRHGEKTIFVLGVSEL